MITENTARQAGGRYVKVPLSDLIMPNSKKEIDPIESRKAILTKFRD